MIVDNVDLEIKKKMETAVQSADNTLRVIPRWLLKLKSKDWGSALRSLNRNSKIHGVLISRKGQRFKRYPGGANHKWSYAVYVFESYEAGTNADNSEDRLNLLLQQIHKELETRPTLGFDSDDEMVCLEAIWQVTDHDGFQAEVIDMLDDDVHMVAGEVVVNLTENRVE